MLRTASKSMAFCVSQQHVDAESGGGQQLRGLVAARVSWWVLELHVVAAEPAGLPWIFCASVLTKKPLFASVDI